MFASSAALMMGVSLVVGAELEKDTHRMPTRYFALPIQLSAARRAEIDHVLLHVSVDRGKTWHRADRARPSDERFAFLAPEDGVYWFVQQTVDRGDRKEPAKLEPDTKGIVKVLVEANGANLNGNGIEPDMRARLEAVERRLLEFEKRIEEMELRARVRRLERSLAEMQKKQTASR